MSFKGVALISSVILSLLIISHSLIVPDHSNTHALPSRADGLDISLIGITSHTNGSAVPMVEQVIVAWVKNNGTLELNSSIALTLTIWFPASGASSTVVFSNTTDLTGLLSLPGSELNHSFPGWTPSSTGRYRINVSVQVADDHPQNDLLEIFIDVVDMGEYAFELINIGPSSQTMERGKSTLDSPYRPYQFMIMNRGSTGDSYSISAESRWIVSPYQTGTGIIDPGEMSSAISFNVLVPADALVTDWDTMVIRVVSNGDENVSAVAVVNTSIAVQSGVSITADPPVQKGYPGGPWINFTFVLTNSGDLADNYAIKAVPRPSNWIVRLWSSSLTPVLSKGESTIIRAGIRIPELEYDSMMADLTYRGALGALVIQADSPISFAQGSAEGLVDVGLVHTVEMRVDPRNHTVPWHREGYREVRFNISVRSVNNDGGLVPPPMDIRLTAPNGPQGVLFTPRWSVDPNETESKRWAAGYNRPELYLPSGQWSQWVQLKVIYPPFPFEGRGDSLIMATPQINETFDGMSIPKTRTVSIFIQLMLNFTVSAPEWSFFSRPEAEADADGNGIPDWKEGAPGDRLLLPFNVTNTGNSWDSYRSSAAAIPQAGSVKLPMDWVLGFPAGSSVGPLLPYLYDTQSPQHSSIIWVQVTVPRGTPIGERVNISLRVNSMTDPPMERRASVTITVKQGFGLDLEPETTEIDAHPDETVSTMLNLTNMGNGIDTVRIQLSQPALSGWTVSFEEATFDLEPGRSRSFRVLITPSIDASADRSLSLKVKASSIIAPSVWDEVYINVTVIYVGQAVIRAASPTEVWKVPGDFASFELEIKNEGNGNDSFDLDLINDADQWIHTISAGPMDDVRSVSIPRGRSEYIWVNITLPELGAAGSGEDLSMLRIRAMEKVISDLKVIPRRDRMNSAEIQLSVGVLQAYRSSIFLRTGELSTKNVLPGEECVFHLFIENRGNGPDNITAEIDAPTRYMRWSRLDGAAQELEPFNISPLEVSILPDPADLPLYEEEVTLSISSFAGDGQSYRLVRLYAFVVMSRIIGETLDVDLGQSSVLKVRICNMPDPGEVPILGFPLQKNYTIVSYLFIEGDFSRGWQLADQRRSVILTGPYEYRDVDIELKAPDDLIDGAPYARINLEIEGGPRKTQSHVALARAVFFDIFIDTESSTFFNLYEGQKGRSTLRFITTGNRNQEVIPVKVLLDGDEIGEYTIGPANPADSYDFKSSLFLEVEFDIPGLLWYEKGRALDLRIVIDPEDTVVENTVAGRGEAESNNVMSKDMVIMNYSPPLPITIGVFGLMLVIAAAGLLGYVMGGGRRSLYLLPFSIGLSGVMAILFYLPFESRGNIALANGFGAAIIIIDLMLILPLMIILLTRAGNAHIRYLMSKKGLYSEGDEGASIRTPLIPLGLSLAGGIMLSVIPLAIWLWPSYINENGISGIYLAFTDSTAWIPVWSMIIVSAFAAVSLQLLTLMLKRRSLMYLMSISDQLERLNREIKEGFA